MDRSFALFFAAAVLFVANAEIAVHPLPTTVPPIVVDDGTYLDFYQSPYDNIEEATESTEYSLAHLNLTSYTIDTTGAWSYATSSFNAVFSFDEVYVLIDYYMYVLIVSPSGKDYNFAYCSLWMAGGYDCTVVVPRNVEPGQWTLYVVAIRQDYWYEKHFTYELFGEVHFDVISLEDVSPPACDVADPQPSPVGVGEVNVDYVCTDEPAGIKDIAIWYRLAAWPLVQTYIDGCDSTGYPINFPLAGEWIDGTLYASDLKGTSDGWDTPVPSNWDLYSLPDVVIPENTAAGDTEAPVCNNMTVLPPAPGYGYAWQYFIECDDDVEELSLMAYFAVESAETGDITLSMPGVAVNIGRNAFQILILANLNDYPSATYTFLGYIVTDAAGNYAIYGDKADIPKTLLKNEWEKLKYPEESSSSSSTGTDDDSSGGDASSADSTDSSTGDGGDDDDEQGSSAVHAAAAPAVVLFVSLLFTVLFGLQ